MNIPDKAIVAAARAHYVYVWHSVDCDAEAAAARWDGGEVEGDVMAYHGNHVRHQIEAAAPFIAAQALRDASDALDSWHSESLDGGPWDSGFLHASDMVRDRADELDPQ